MIKLKNILSEIDFHSKLSRGHKPDHYQLGTSDFKPFDEEELNEGMTKNIIQSIVDKVYPSIINDLGKSIYGNKVPTVELHTDIYARLSGIPGATGDESHSSEAEYDDEENKIFVYYPNMKSEQHVIESLLHEYTHSLQDPTKWAEYRKSGYENNPFEKEASKAEKNWRKYI